MYVYVFLQHNNEMYYDMVINIFLFYLIIIYHTEMNEIGSKAKRISLKHSPFKDMILKWANLESVPDHGS